MREIAVRGFINEKYNTTFGKGLFRRALYNGSVELRNPNGKYLVDFYRYPEWEAMAKDDQQIAIINKIQSTDFKNGDEFLFSWVMHYDPLTKIKTKVDGYCIYSPETRELYVNINDPENKTIEDWVLDVHHCKSVGVNKPVFIAANVDLV